MGIAAAARWRRSGRASAGLPPYVCKLQAPSVARARGCQQRWHGQRGRASGAIGARRLRKWRIFHACRPSGLFAAAASKLIASVLLGVCTYLFRRLVIFTHVCWCVLQSRGGDLHSTLLLNFRLRRHESTLLIPFQGALLVLFSRRFLATGLGVKTGF